MRAGRERLAPELIEGQSGLGSPCDCGGVRVVCVGLSSTSGWAASIDDASHGSGGFEPCDGGTGAGADVAIGVSEAGSGDCGGCEDAKACGGLQDDCVEDSLVKRM